eukprot:Gregarina_sp_Poly_1__10384@NODE_744_length_6481_cov_177_190833_g555_i0_p1_GENE_NODE_744_length_6481_cov_177_190833_g555_i0NODE_744_length_6481_cov_177_190833_g555_i0_p1_ORF_typecomplete_len313_score19_14C2/PF00168_30/2_2e20_NODE_744_length_6481_cov_177_190833_g555_i016922630
MEKTTPSIHPPSPPNNQLFMPLGPTVQVTIHEGKGLKSGGLLSRTDPYVVVQLGTRKQKTSVIRSGGSNPKWEQDFIFNNASEPMLKFSVMSRESFSADECLGSVEFPIAAIQVNGKFNGEIPLTRKNGKNGGVLKLTIAQIQPDRNVRKLSSPLPGPPSFAGSNFNQDTTEPPLVQKVSTPINSDQAASTPRARHVENYMPNVTMCTPRHQTFLSSCMAPRNTPGSANNPFAMGAPAAADSADFTATRACPHCGERRVYIDESFPAAFHPALYVRHPTPIVRHSTSPLRARHHHHHHHHHRRCPCASAAAI